VREDLRNAFDKSGKLKNWALPMPKYEEMEAVLTNNEQVLSVIKAGINGKHVGVAILTDNGVHLLGRGTFKSLSPYSESFSLKHVTGVTRQRNLMYMGFTIEISRAGNVDSLIKSGVTHNFTVDVQELAGGAEVISSSRIRNLVLEGKVTEARELLSRPHRLDGIVVHGEKRGREIGYPTANLGKIDGQTIPADGIYAGWLTVGINFWPAAISIGTNPTFEGDRGRQVEAYALDQEGLDLYDKEASIEFGWFLRPTLKFDSLDALLVQMKKDCDKARELTEK
jgi:FAD synthase